MTEREKERAAVVAWLRTLKRWEVDYWGPGGIAEEIEAGRHMKGTRDE